jgi:tRNA threonylcarbamoyladenosine biosynthesis protein TsaE
MTSRNLAQTKQAAVEFLKKLKSGERATVVALTGNLGAGKTAFVKCVGEILGIREEITSPTFVIEKIYSLKKGTTDLTSRVDIPFKKMIHIDAYRLESGQDLIKLNWDHIVVDPANLIFIEWPERVADIIPDTARKISFTFIDESTREIVF